MKKFLFALILPIIALAVCSCEEEESPLRFSTEYISDPENVDVKYYSPDPSCVAKMYWIEANNCAGELTIKCTNANSILIKNHEGAETEEFVSPQGHWKAVVSNSNIITFSFEEFDNESEDDHFSNVGLMVVSQTKKGTLRTSIQVVRYSKM